MSLSKSELQARVDAVGFWWHSIDLGQGVVTPGHKTPHQLRHELEVMRLPDLRGKTVLDVGTWDGFFAFEAERRGAKRVVAQDHHIWARGHKAGFELAHETLGSQVDPHYWPFREFRWPEPFDIVLFLGVLYHMEDPLAGLKRLRELTGELAIIETHAINVPGHEDMALCEFYPEDQLAGDCTNWWGPNVKALEGLCRAAGFGSFEIVYSNFPMSTRPSYSRVIAHVRP